MFWRSIKNALGIRQESVTPDTNAKIADLAQRIDAIYDSMLYPGMPMAEVIDVEQQRAPHTGNWRRTRWRKR